MPKLLEAVEQIHRGDCQEWEARRLYDGKRRQLAGLKTVLLDGDLEALIHAYLVLLKTGKTAASSGSDKDDLD